MRKFLAVAIMALSAAPLFADVELTTSINDVFNRGTNELAGSITMRVNADDFAIASTLEPVFIRITLDHNAVLAETLVNLLSADPDINVPIYLAMTLNSDSSLATLNSDKSAVSIVRWRKGESNFWIRVQESSSNWVENSMVTFPPDDDNLVSWTVGISARQSFVTTQAVAVEDRNLPFNTRDLSCDPDPVFSVSTLICVDLSGSDLDVTGVESLLNFDPIAFDAGVDPDGNGDPNNVQGGNDTGINFTNDFSIARGRRRECTVEVVGKGAPAFGLLCIPRAGLNASEQGFIWITNQIWFEIDCRRGGNFIATDLFDGAFITFSTGGRGNYGFENGSARFLEGGVGFDEPVSGTGFNNNGRTLYREIDLIWAGGFRPLDQYRLHVEVDVHTHYTDDPVDVLLDWEIVLVNHDGQRDEFPFNGDDQFRRCAPSQFSIATGQWDYGYFIDCAGSPAVLFFPYMPKLKGDTALFWTGLSIVNQGFVDFEQLDVIIYAENGDRFTAEFPGLDTRNQYTWLLIQGDAGTGFYEMGTEDPPIIPEPSDPVVDPESFGDTRMSMFVVGNFVAEFTDDIFSGDLDGYLLIGKDTDIDGSYLPRNYDNDIPGQNADLPLRRSKQTIRPVSNVLGDHVEATYKFEQGRWVNKGDFK